MPKSRGKRSQNKQAKGKLDAERAVTAEAARAAGAIESTGNSGLAPSTFAPCEKTAARLILTPFPAAPRAPAALSAASGRSPRALGGFSVQTLASSGARSAMSPSGERRWW
jgi:hypothetical protein